MRIGRRQLLKASAAGAGAAVLGGFPIPGLAERHPGPGYVVKVTSERMYRDGQWQRRFPDPEVATRMVHEAVKRLAREDDVGAAFRRFVRPTDRVGLKINVLGGRFSTTSLEVTNAVVEGVRAAGVPEDRIQIFDQYQYGFVMSRYTLTDRPRDGQIRTVNHDMVGFEDEPIEANGLRLKLVRSLLWCDSVISMPVIKDHDIAGVTCALKNLSCGVVERPSRLHGTMTQSVARVYAHDAIRSRVKLVVCDGATVLYNDGPKHNFDHCSVHNSVYATTDPVAMDRIAHEVIEGERASHRLPPLARVGRPASFIEEGERLGLGVGRRDEIVLDAFTV